MKKIYILLLSVLVLSCSGSDDGAGPTGGDGDPDNPDGGGDQVMSPTAALLVFPLESSVCTEGKDFTDTTSTITFRWMAGEHTTDYKLLITDIANNNTVQEYSVSSSTTDVFLDVPNMRRGSQYLYKVVSSNSGTNTAESKEWAFFNAGISETSYAPFPATVIAPEKDASLTAISSITLDWNGSDLDGPDDIVCRLIKRELIYDKIVFFNYQKRFLNANLSFLIKYL